MRSSGTRIAELLRAAEHTLKGMDTARLDAEVLLDDLLAAGREWLYAHPEHEVPAAKSRDFYTLIHRRREGFPVAYLTGHREFWSLDLLVNTNTLIPRPETEGVVEVALERIRGLDAASMLDLGTGSGAIALALAHERPDCRIVASDISADALAVARQNASRHGIRGIEFVQSDWFSGLAGRRFDLIVCNPPYVDTRDHALIDGEIRFEPRLALDGGHAGMQAITTVVSSATHHLAARGSLVLEHGADQGAAVRRLLAHCGFAAIETLRDAAGLDRTSHGRWE